MSTAKRQTDESLQPEIPAAETQRDRTRETPKESRRKLEKAQRMTRVGHWEHDLKTNQVTCSAEAYRIFALTPRSQMCFEDFLRLVHPDDQARVAHFAADWLTETRPRSVDYRIVRADGQERFLHSEGKVVDVEAGRPLRVFCTLQDITERKQSENELRQSARKLRLVIDTIPAMAWIVLPTGALDFINQRWLEYSGLCLEEALAEPTRTMHPEDIPKVVEQWSKDMAAKRPYEGEMRLRRADGEYRWFLVRTMPLLDQHGNVIEWYGTSTDIEDQKRAEEDLRETQAVLARVARASVIGELTASIAHEVNQPLGAIVTNAEAGLCWLSDDSPNLKEARQALKRIVRDGNRAGKVVTGIRSLLKKDKPAKSQFKLDEAIREIIALTKAEARHRKVCVQMKLGPNLPHVSADRVQIQQLLMNLVMNSLDALSGVAEPRILMIQADSESANWVRISIQDNGVGIDAHQMKSIFEPLYTTKPHGLGLGLSISRSIVEAHGGQLEVCRNNGPGVTFQATLPVNGNSAS